MLVCAVVIMAVSVGVVVTLQRAEANRAFSETNAVNSLLTSMLDQESALQGYINTRQHSFLTTYRSGRRAFERELPGVRRVTGNDELAILDQQVTTARKWQALAQTTLLNLPASKPAVIGSSLFTLNSLMNQFREQNQRLAALVARDHDQAIANGGLLSVLTVAGLSLLFTIFGYFAIVKPSRREKQHQIRRQEFLEELQTASDEDSVQRLLLDYLRSALSGPLTICLTQTPAHSESPSPLLPATFSVPIKSGRAIIGSLSVVRRRPLKAREESLVREAVAQIAPVQENLRTLAMAQHKALTDSLTNLPNQRAIREQLDLMVAQAKRQKSPLTAVFFDLDHFKAINDEFGHAQGDAVLKAAAATASAATRGSDFLGRYGGEEFILLLPDTDTKGAVLVADKVREALSQQVINGIDRAVTGSFGLATYPSDAEDIESLLRLADSALYEAKESGRNCVRSANSAETPDSKEPTVATGSKTKTV